MSVSQIKIVSDGTAANTQIYDCDGKIMKGVAGFGIFVKAGGLVNAVLTFDNVILDVIAQAELSQDEVQDGSE